jgi:hypothetical protein
MAKKPKPSYLALTTALQPELVIHPPPKIEKVPVPPRKKRR